MDPTAITQTRRFNRTVVEQIGALSDHFLGRPRPMGESRALWEIGPDGLEIRALRTRLGLDSGYASRVLRALERQGLVTVTASPEDGRVRRADLTEAGRAEYAEINRRSDEVAANILQPLSQTQRERLVAAMAEVEHLLHASMVRVTVEDPTSQDATWCLSQYYADLNTLFETGFDLANGLPLPQQTMQPPSGLLVLARLRDRPIGCGAMKFEPNATVYLKRMWVAPEARGLGVGRRLLQALEDHAREAGARLAHLETNRALQTAIALYRSAGYTEVSPFNDEFYAHHWFEKRLVP
jgi:DNA-binding MarR family transcriptional regulator/GNAT superfamily N-acetyltransferase